MFTSYALVTDYVVVVTKQVSCVYLLVRLGDYA